MRKLFRLSIAAVLFAATVGPASARAGDIKGRVIVNGSKPTKGVPFATVILTGKANYNFNTDQDGHYTKSGIDNGDYQLDVTANQYMLVFAPDPVTINNGVNTPNDAVMDKRSTNSKVLYDVGAHFTTFAADDKAKTYALMWNTLTRSHVSAASKRLVLAGIVAEDPGALDVYQPFKEYTEYSAVRIASLEKDLARTIDSGEVPKKSKFDVSDAVLKDVVVFELVFNTKPEKRARFLEQLEQADDSMGWKSITPDVRKKVELFKDAAANRDRSK